MIPDIVMVELMPYYVPRVGGGDPYAYVAGQGEAEESISCRQHRVKQ
ncbi:MAG: hypothetical protein PHO01_10050 [Desulfotomaculaceae bacterium]|nr:hypothetical protein [Desulfotomaculaceae bacterium]